MLTKLFTQARVAQPRMWAFSSSQLFSTKPVEEMTSWEKRKNFKFESLKSDVNTRDYEVYDEWKKHNVTTENPFIPKPEVAR